MRPLYVTAGRLAIATLGATIAAGTTGCVETSVYEKTSSQLEAATRAGQQKDQQIRALEWQVVTLAQQMREAQLRSEAAQRELGAEVQRLVQANAALAEKLKAKDDEGGRPPLPFPGDDGPGATPIERRRNEDLRRLVKALDAQNTRLMERLTRLEQKIDARAGEDRSRPRAAARPDPAASSGDIVDPWGFGARK
ncbi:MAG: hypothetical protein QM820_04015 [Minicystis sp.]